jgi:hypothetical protein
MQKLFEDSTLDRILPPSLSEQIKGRLVSGIKDITTDCVEFMRANKFYLPKAEQPDHFLQGDIVREIRYPYFNSQTGQYEKRYSDALILSNTCDMDIDGNSRKIEKQISITPLIPFNSYIKNIELTLSKSIAENLASEIQSQRYSNLLYLPDRVYSENTGYVAHLDQISFISPYEIKVLKNSIQGNRISSLSQVAFYLFIFKLSYHMFRLPESPDRPYS